MEQENQKDLEKKRVIVRNIITGEQGTLIKHIKRTGESIVNYDSKGLEVTVTQDLETIYP